MKLEWTGETVKRVPGENGEKVEVIESIRFNVLDNDGNSLGNAKVDLGNANLNINVYGFNSVEEGVAKLKEAVGITDEADE